MEKLGAEALRTHPHFEGDVQHIKAGASGYVYRATHVSYGEVAVKLIPLTRVRNDLKHFVYEVINHRRLSGHAHIIAFKYIFALDGYVAIVMEYANQGNLVDYVRHSLLRVRNREGLIRWFFQQLMTALDYCHQNGVVNRDLKLDNTLLSKLPSGKYPFLKICDFGHSKSADVSPAATLHQIGTYSYLAPEILTGLFEQDSAQRSPYDGKALDVWSCGVMLYALMYGKLPFGNISVTNKPKEDLITQLKTALQRMESAEYHIPDQHIQPVSGDYLDLLRQMLEPNPQQRIDVSGVMRHAWFTENLKPDILTYNDRVRANREKHLRKSQTETDILMVLQQAVGRDHLTHALQQTNLLAYLS